MPWTAKDAAKHDKKANSAIAQRQWSHVANSVLAKTGDDGRAIREANAVIARRSHGLDSVKKFADGGKVHALGGDNDELRTYIQPPIPKRIKRAIITGGVGQDKADVPSQQAIDEYRDSRTRKKEEAAGAPTGYAHGGPVNIHGVAMPKRMSMHQQKMMRG